MSDDINANTKPMAQIRNEKGQIIGGTPPAGFNIHPENRSDGGWNKTMVFSYQYRRFMNMTLKELAAYALVPDSERTVVEDLAYKRVYAAQKSLPDVKEITDRTEGKPIQTIISSEVTQTTEDKIREFLDGPANDQRVEPTATTGDGAGTEVAQPTPDIQ